MIKDFVSSYSRTHFEYNINLSDFKRRIKQDSINLFLFISVFIFYIFIEIQRMGVSYD